MMEQQTPFSREESAPGNRAGTPAGNLAGAWEARRRYAESVVLVVAGTALSALLHSFLSPTNLVMIYLLTVVVAAIYLGRGPSFLAAVLGVLAFDFFFVPPRFTLTVSDTEYLLTFGALLAVSLVISSLTARVRDQADTARLRESQTAELYALSRDLAAAVTLDGILHAAVTHIARTFVREVAILLPAPGEEQVELRAASSELTLDGEWLSIAAWTLQHGQPAGRGTDILPAAGIRCLPLKTSHGVIGVLGVKPIDPASLLTPGQRDLLQAFADQAALAIERAQLAEQAQQAELLRSTERLQHTLLNMISHDLRTPLVSITGALSSLQEDGIHFDEATRRSLLENARQESDRLNRLVGNLLDMTRIEAGALHLNREPCDVQDLIGSSLEQSEPALQGHPLAVDVPGDLPLVSMDFVLMVQVLANLLDNAGKYSPPGLAVEVHAVVDGPDLLIDVADRGSGIPPGDLEHAFDKFYRVQQPGHVLGTGLGLSICKGIVEAHGGRIWVENRAGGGMRVALTLPLADEEEQAP